MGLISSVINLTLSIVSFFIIIKIEPYLNKIKHYRNKIKYQKFFYFIIPVLITSLFYLLF